MYNFDTDIRKLHSTDIEELAKILQLSDSWRKLMARIKNENGIPLFSSDHVKIIENGSRLVKKSESELFLEEWSVLGKKRPTCRILLDYLVEAELFRAADYLAVNVLKIEPPERPQSGPAAKIEIDDRILANLLKQQARVNAPRGTPETWSLNYQENTAELVCDEQQRRVDDNSAQPSDLIKFSRTESDLIKFSKTQPEITNEDEDDNFELQVAESQDIPFFVNHREEQPKSSKTDSETNETNNESSTSEVNTTLSSSQATAAARENDEKFKRNLESGAKNSKESPTQQFDDYSYSTGDVPIPVVVMEINAKVRQPKSQADS